ncbi:MAG: hypothetical protein CSA83_01825 [Actinomycetales bacterium]|nr:MAG: hypothetical protein CSA83_01825 [Actinomycetales bacterium]
MKKLSKHTPEQIVIKLEKAASLKNQGVSGGDIARALGISEATLYRWIKDYGSMSRSEAQEFKRLKEENTRLKRLLAEAELDKAALKELAEGNF